MMEKLIIQVNKEKFVLISIEFLSGSVSRRSMLTQEKLEGAFKMIDKVISKKRSLNFDRMELGKFQLMS